MATVRLKFLRCLFLLWIVCETRSVESDGPEFRSPESSTKSKRVLQNLKYGFFLSKILEAYENENGQDGRVMMRYPVDDSEKNSHNYLENDENPDFGSKVLYKWFEGKDRSVRHKRAEAKGKWKQQISGRRSNRFYDSSHFFHQNSMSHHSIVLDHIVNPLERYLSNLGRFVVHFKKWEDRKHMEIVNDNIAGSLFFGFQDIKNNAENNTNPSNIASDLSTKGAEKMITENNEDFTANPFGYRNANTNGKKTSGIPQNYAHIMHDGKKSTSNFDDFAEETVFPLNGKSDTQSTKVAVSGKSQTVISNTKEVDDNFTELDDICENNKIPIISQDDFVNPKTLKIKAESNKEPSSKTANPVSAKQLNSPKEAYDIFRDLAKMSYGYKFTTIGQDEIFKEKTPQLDVKSNAKSTKMTGDNGSKKVLSNTDEVDDKFTNFGKIGDTNKSIAIPESHFFGKDITQSNGNEAVYTSSISEFLNEKSLDYEKENSDIARDDQLTEIQTEEHMRIGEIEDTSKFSEETTENVETGSFNKTGAENNESQPNNSDIGIQTSPYKDMLPQKNMEFRYKKLHGVTYQTETVSDSVLNVSESTSLIHKWIQKNYFAFENSPKKDKEKLALLTLSPSDAVEGNSRNKETLRKVFKAKTPPLKSTIMEYGIRVTEPQSGGKTSANVLVEDGQHSYNSSIKHSSGNMTRTKVNDTLNNTESPSLIDNLTKNVDIAFTIDSFRDSEKILHNIALTDITDGKDSQKIMGTVKKAFGTLPYDFKSGTMGVDFSFTENQSVDKTDMSMEVEDIQHFHSSFKPNAVITIGNTRNDDVLTTIKSTYLFEKRTRVKDVTFPGDTFGETEKNFHGTAPSDIADENPSMENYDVFDEIPETSTLKIIPGIINIQNSFSNSQSVGKVDGTVTLEDTQRFNKSSRKNASSVENIQQEPHEMIGSGESDAFDMELIGKKYGEDFTHNEELMEIGSKYTIRTPFDSSEKLEYLDILTDNESFTNETDALLYNPQTNSFPSDMTIETSYSLNRNQAEVNESSQTTTCALADGCRLFNAKSKITYKNDRKNDMVEVEDVENLRNLTTMEELKTVDVAQETWTKTDHTTASFTRKYRPHKIVTGSMMDQGLLLDGQSVDDHIDHTISTSEITAKVKENTDMLSGINGKAERPKVTTGPQQEYYIRRIPVVDNNTGIITYFNLNISRNNLGARNYKHWVKYEKPGFDPREYFQSGQYKRKSLTDQRLKRSPSSSSQANLILHSPTFIEEMPQDQKLHVSTEINRYGRSITGRKSHRLYKRANGNYSLKNLLKNSLKRRAVRFIRMV